MSLKGLKSKLPPVAPGEKKRPQKVKKGAAGHLSSAGSILKVVKQVHPKLRVSKQAMAVLDSCVADLFERLATESGRLCRMSGGSTLTSREVEAAVHLVLPGELAKHAASEGERSLQRFKQHGNGQGNGQGKGGQDVAGEVLEV